MPPIVSLWSWHDSMVAPQTIARVDVGENIELAGIGHNALLADRQCSSSFASEIACRRAIELTAAPTRQGALYQ